MIATIHTPILFNSLSTQRSRSAARFHTFSKTISSKVGCLWSGSDKAERSSYAPLRHFNFSQSVGSKHSALWNSNKQPVFDMGDNLTANASATIELFSDVNITDVSGIIDTIEYRVGDNTWISSDKDLINMVEYAFEEIGSVPAQIRATAVTNEIFYSREKYITVLSNKNPDLRVFLTSTTDFSSTAINSFGGLKSDVEFGQTSRLLTALSGTSSEIQVLDLSKFPAQGNVAIDDEIISYNSKTSNYPNTLKGCERGQYGTAESFHKNDSIVKSVDNLELLFDNVKKSHLNNDTKIDYRAICVKNVGSTNSGDISIHFPNLPDDYNDLENLRFAIEKSQLGTTNFSQEIVSGTSIPTTSDNGTKLISVFPKTLKGDDLIDKQFSPDSLLGYISKTNISSDGEYLFITDGYTAGEIILRFSTGGLVTTDQIIYNSSLKEYSSAQVSWRMGDAESEINVAAWTDFDPEDSEINTKVSRKILKFSKFIDFKIVLERSYESRASSSFGDLDIIYWDDGFSNLFENIESNIAKRKLRLSGNQPDNSTSEFAITFPEDTSSSYFPRFKSDNYVIQSTFANAVDSGSYALKFKHAIAFDFVSSRSADLEKIVLYEKRIDWDNSTESEINLTLNVIIYDGDIDDNGNAIGSSSKNLTLTSKVAKSSNREFTFSNLIPLEEGKRYWVLAWATSSPDVNGEWRIKGTNDLLFGNPNKLSIKIYNLRKGTVKHSDLSNFAIGFAAIGRIDSFMTGHLNFDSTVFYKLSPQNVKGKSWDFDGINIEYNQPYHHAQKIGPFIRAVWKKNNEVKWHRFRPVKINQISGTQQITPSNKYKTISSSEYVIIKIEINKVNTTASAENFGLIGLGAQPAINYIEGLWSQKIKGSLVNNLVSSWMKPPTDIYNAIKLSEIDSSWSDNLEKGEQYFIWLKRDFTNIKNPAGRSGFTISLNHGVNLFSENKSFDRSVWQEIGAETIPSPPASISIKSFTEDTYQVTWGEVFNAIAYEIEEEKLGDDFISVGATTETAFVFNKDTEDTFRYKVRAVNSAGKSNYITSGSISITLTVIEESSSSSSGSSSSSSSSSTSSSSSSSSSSPSSSNSSSSSSLSSSSLSSPSSSSLSSSSLSSPSSSSLSSSSLSSPSSSSPSSSSSSESSSDSSLSSESSDST